MKKEINMEKELLHYITMLIDDTINGKVEWYRFIGADGNYVYTAQFYEVSIVFNEKVCLLIRYDNEGYPQTKGFEKEKMSKDEQDAWTVLIEVVKGKASDL